MTSLDAAAHRSAAASSPPGDARGVGESGPPDTLSEAAEKFEQALVRQFVKVMTKDMFSQSHAGQGGGNWMESQRGRQRDLMTDMIADRLAKADTLEVSEKLAKEWGIDASDAARASTNSEQSKQTDSHPVAPAETSAPSRPLIDTPPPHDNPRIDRAV
jgi:Rod binding domain-containing protein